MIGKWLELLKEMAPRVNRAKLLFNPMTAPFFVVWLRELGALSVASIELEPAVVHDQADIEATISTLAREPGTGLVTGADVFTVANRRLIIGLAERYRLPAMYQFRQFAAEGGLMSYGPDTADIFRRAAAYVDRILKGANPAELPVQQPTKFQLVINLKTAKALELTVSPLLLADRRIDHARSWHQPDAPSRQAGLTMSAQWGEAGMQRPCTSVWILTLSGHAQPRIADCRARLMALSTSETAMPRRGMFSTWM